MYDDLAARAAIHDLIVRYALAIDARDFERVAACFAENAEATYSGVEVPSGREAITEWLQANFTAVTSTHLLGTPLIELRGDRADTVTPAVSFLLEGREGELHLHTRGLR